MKDQFIETWLINNRVNLILLDAISEEGLFYAMQVEDGKSPAELFQLMHNVRFWRLNQLDKQFIEHLQKFEDQMKYDRELLRYRLIESSEAVAKFLECGYNRKGKIKGYRRGVFTFMGYLIAYESHLRGQMLLGLKLSGHMLPKSVSYGIWDWNKI